MTDLRVEISPLATYLGDGVYIFPSTHEANAWWLVTYNGYQVVEQIYLEWEVANRLRQELDATTNFRSET